MLREQSGTVIVTGASAGVGRAVALRFAGAGWRVGLIARDEQSLKALADEICAAGGEAAIAAADARDAGAIIEAAGRFEGSLGPIDLWINDAMVTVFSPVHALTPAEFKEVTEVTYLGVVHGCMAALKHMRTRGRGHIINIGSALAYRGIPLQSAYCGAKNAIRGFTAALRTEQEHDRTNIRVSLVELPAMNTPQFEWARTHMPREPRPMGTVYQPEVAANAVFRAASSPAREYWVGLSTFLTIIGNMIAPNFMDRFLARTAVEGQEIAVPVAPDRKDNLFAPVAKFHRTHGRFDGIAKDRAIVVSGSAARVAVVAGGALTFFVLGALLRPRPKARRGARFSGRSPVRFVRGS